MRLNVGPAYPWQTFPNPQMNANTSVITGTDYRAASGYNLHSVAAARQ